MILKNHGTGSIILRSRHRLAVVETILKSEVLSIEISCRSRKMESSRIADTLNDRSVEYPGTILALTYERNIGT